MRLTAKQSYALLEKHRCYVSEACDRCGQILGTVRFTRKGESGEWCSRQCRDGVEAREPRTCRHCRARLPEGKRRGAAFCDDACKQAAHRTKPITQKSGTAKLSVTKPSIYAAFSRGKERVGISSHLGVFGGFAQR
jgi:hypothetical protein